MHELNSGKYLGSDVRNLNINGVWTSLARYDASVYLNSKNRANDWHFHQNPHFSFFLEGGNIERRKTSSSECVPGQVRFYRAGEAHQNVNVVYPSKNLNVEIDAKFISKYNLKEQIVDSNFGAASEMKFTMLRIYKEAADLNETSELEIHSLVLGLFSAREHGAKNQFRLPKWVGKVSEILRDRWNENLSLKDLSEASGVHPVTISRHVPKYFACTLGEFVRRVRIEKSLALIKQTDKPLTDIAHCCGFADQSHFSRVFKELTGLQPSSFRKI